jgi:hypothetical protein
MNAVTSATTFPCCPWHFLSRASREWRHAMSICTDNISVSIAPAKWSGVWIRMNPRLEQSCWGVCLNTNRKVCVEIELGASAKACGRETGLDAFASALFLVRSFTTRWFSPEKAACNGSTPSRTEFIGCPLEDHIVRAQHLHSQRQSGEVLN